MLFVFIEFGRTPVISMDTINSQIAWFVPPLFWLLWIFIMITLQFIVLGFEHTVCFQLMITVVVLSSNRGGGGGVSLWATIGLE